MSGTVTFKEISIIRAPRYDRLQEKTDEQKRQLESMPIDVYKNTINNQVSLKVCAITIEQLDACYERLENSCYSGQGLFEPIIRLPWMIQSHRYEIGRDSRGIYVIDGTNGKFVLGDIKDIKTLKELLKH